MVNDRRSPDSGPANNVQDVEVPGVPRSPQSPVYDASRVRNLNFRAVRSHYLHIQNGNRKGPRCSVCSQGLEGALEKVEKKRPPTAPVAEGAGTDEEGPTPPARDSRSKAEQRELLW